MPGFLLKIGVKGRMPLESTYGHVDSLRVFDVLCGILTLHLTTFFSGKPSLNSLE